MNLKKLAKIVGSSLVAVIAIFIYSQIFGNPISYMIAKININEYIQKYYKDTLKLDGISYNLMMNGYVGQVVDKEDSRCTSYITYHNTGYIADGYQSSINQNMSEEIVDKLSYMIGELTNIKNEDISLYSEVQMPKFKYRMFDKYEGQEPIKLRIWLHEDLKLDKINNGEKMTKVEAFHKNKEIFIKDAYEIVKVLKQTTYKYENIEIYSYLEDGNKNYRLEIVNLNDINNINDLENKMFIRDDGKIKEQEIENYENK